MAAAAETIKAWRERAGMTQAQVAAHLRVSEGAASQWETGRSTPTQARALRLDELLGAGGQIVEACGYTISLTPSDEVAELRQQVADLSEHVAHLTAQVAKLGAAAEKSARRSRPGGT